MCKMADPGFSDDYLKDDTFRLRDDDIFIKEEIELASGESFPNSSACMPIPTRRTLNSLSDIRDYGVDYMTSSPLMLQDHDKYTTINPNVLWSGKIEENDREEVTKMEDDIFQVDKSDLIQDSNLTELNTNQDILDDLNFDDLMLPAELSCVINVPHISRHSSGLYPLMNTPVSSFDSSYASSCLTENISLYKDSMESSSLPSSPLNITTSSSKTYVSLEGNSNNPNSPILSPTHNNQKHSSLHELLVKKDSQLSSSKVLGQSVPGVAILQSRSAFSRSSPSSRLSSSAPTHLTMDQIWQRREPRQHLLSTGSLVEAGSTSSLSTGSVLSPEAYDFSLDETCDSEDESDQDDDFSTDAESSDGEGTSSSNSKNAKKERYFWQYNVQSKGPKGQRLVLKSQLEDPHCLNEITDPVFSPDCSLQGIKHSGKARKGDGNDLTPNPKKLYVIGKELDKLNRVINDMTPVSELPHGARPNTRKEKNKLASRACRLKKKAQHEANKIKLLGLETEHKRLIYAIKQMRLLITGQVAPANSLMDNPETIKNVDKIVKQASRLKIAGQTTEFVNKILEKVKAGVPSGGLDEIGTMTNL